MARKILSHLLISVALFVLTATFFMWTIDNRVLNPDTLSAELRKAGVGQELSELMPEIVTADNNATSEEKADMSSKISKVVTSEYVDSKLAQITDSVLTFVREGEPQPQINLSDFPQQLKAAGIEADGDFADGFEKPIEINKEGKLDNIHNAYQIFSMVKYAGLILFAILMLLEWYVAEKGQKLKRISRVFLYAGISYLIYWVALIVAPSQLIGKLQESVQANYDTAGIIGAILKAVQGLFSSYFLSFTILCLGIALVLYVIRHYRHGDVLPSTGVNTSSKTTKK